MRRRGFALVVAMLVMGAASWRIAQAGSAPESSDPSVHLNYASILFYKGRSLIQAGEKEAGEAIFEEVERELRLAIKLSESDADERRKALLNSQSAYLLGEVYFFVFGDRDKAKASYQEALRAIPDHDGAIQALQRFE
jgi:tetratricopeptide (TPR) repeat protein